MSLIDLLKKDGLRQNLFTETQDMYQQKEITMNSTTRTKNALTHAEVYKLTRWIETNQNNLLGRTHEHISQMATQELGLKVTVSNIPAAAKILGISLGFRTNKPGDIPKDVSRALARSLRDLYKRLGEEVPDVIHAIAER